MNPESLAFSDPADVFAAHFKEYGIESCRQGLNEQYVAFAIYRSLYDHAMYMTNVIVDGSEPGVHPEFDARVFGGVFGFVATIGIPSQEVDRVFANRIYSLPNTVVDAEGDAYDYDARAAMDRRGMSGFRASGSYEELMTQLSHDLFEETEFQEAFCAEFGLMYTIATDLKLYRGADTIDTNVLQEQLLVASGEFDWAETIEQFSKPPQDEN